MSEYQIGDAVSLKDGVTMDSEFYRKYGDKSHYIVTSISTCSDRYLRFHGHDMGYSPSQFKMYNVENLDFYQPIAVTCQGTIVKNGLEYGKIVRGNYVPLTQGEVLKLQAWLKSQKPFDEDLFKL